MSALTANSRRSSRVSGLALCPLLTVVVLLFGSTPGEAQVSSGGEDENTEEHVDLVIRGLVELEAGDLASAAKSFESAASMGNAVAQHRLAWMYFTGKGVEGNRNEAAMWFRKAADQGIADAQHMLGLMYYGGAPFTQNYEEAAKWFSRAADQGHDPAQALLGDCYANGQGVLQNFVQAAKWYRLAADQGNPTGQIGLAYAYWQGRGVPQDYVRSHMWFNLAAANVGGVEDIGKSVVEARNAVAAQMTPSQIAEAQRLASDWKPTPQKP